MNMIGVRLLTLWLCCMAEVLFSVQSYFNWQAASAATWLNSPILILVGESGQEDVWEFPRAMSAPYTAWTFDNLVCSMEAHTDWIPFEMLFEAARLCLLLKMLMLKKANIQWYMRLVAVAWFSACMCHDCCLSGHLVQKKQECLL